MDWMYLFYFALAGLIFFGAETAGRGRWNEEYTSLRQTKVLQGIAALGVALHHLAQKSCAPWHPRMYIQHGLDPFVSMGYMLVGVFLFCSGLGLYKSYRTKPDYLKGFFRRRILPIVIAFYLSELIYTAVRLAMGERMDFVRILWYLSGLHMANFNAWYVIVIPFFYLAFWAAFRFCKREGTAIFWVFLFTMGYTVLGAYVGHQDDWWMRGEWWYNSIILFPLGLLFAKHEEKITKVLKKGYWFWLLLFIAGFFLLFQWSERQVNYYWGYYRGGAVRVPYALLSAGTQWLVAAFFVMSWFLLMMKVRLGNRALAWLGMVSLDFYLMHGIFVELFGYDFLDLARSLVYIKNPALFTAVVLGCSVPAVLVFRWARMGITGRIQKRPDGGSAPRGQRKTLSDRIRKRRERDEAYGKSLFRRLLVPGITAAVLIGGYFVLQSATAGDGRTQSVQGMQFQAPEGFALQRADSRSVLWKYQGEERRIAYLVLDTEIPDANSRDQQSLENVYENCDWLTESEYYTNPQGIRMVRGFTNISGAPERRYYIDTPGGLMVLHMNENEQFYDLEDCEAAIRQAADSARPAR